MGSINTTQNIGLNQWSKDEKVKRLDFVEDNKKIDDKVGTLFNRATLDGDTLKLTTVNNTEKLISFQKYSTKENTIKNITLNNDILSIIKANESTFDISLSKYASKTETIKDVSINGNLITFVKGGDNGRVEIRLPELKMATDNESGVISKNTIKEITNTILRNIGLNSYDENNSKVNTSNVGDTRKSGFYFVPNLFGNSSAIVFNYVYNQANENKLWGVQLGIEESDNPRLYVRSKRNGTWKEWIEQASKKAVDSNTTKINTNINKINEINQEITRMKALISTKYDETDLATTQEIWVGVLSE